MTTDQQASAFSGFLQGEGVTRVPTSIDNTALDHSLYWIRQNLSPEDVFSETDLSKWAEVNGYVKQDGNA